MESRIRITIVLDGLPVPVLQHPVGPYFLDLGYTASPWTSSASDGR